MCLFQLLISILACLVHDSNNTIYFMLSQDVSWQTVQAPMGRNKVKIQTGSKLLTWWQSGIETACTFEIICYRLFFKESWKMIFIKCLCIFQLNRIFITFNFNDVCMKKYYYIFFFCKNIIFNQFLQWKIISRKNSLECAKPNAIPWAFQKNVHKHSWLDWLRYRLIFKY